MTIAVALSPRAIALARTFAAAWQALADLAKEHPAEAAQIAASNMSHGRSAFPMSVMLDTGPVALVEPVDFAAEIRRELGANSWYELSRDGSATRLYVHENASHDAALSLNGLMATRMRADILSVAGGGGR